MKSSLKNTELVNSKQMDVKAKLTEAKVSMAEKNAE
jgi:hypothetical protein